MNKVLLRFDPFQDKCVISINDVPLAKTANLNRYVNKPLWRSAKTLLEDIGEQVNDDYVLAVVGTRFEINFLEILRQQREECLQQSSEEIVLTDRFEQAFGMMETSRISKLKVFIADGQTAQIDRRYAEVISAPDQAAVCVVADLAKAEEIAETSETELILYVSATPQISFENKKCLWGVAPATLQENLQAVLERFAIPRYIAATEALAQKQSDTELQETVGELRSLEKQVLVTVETEAVEGDELIPLFQCEGQLPAIRIESRNPEVLKVQGNKLLAVREGSCVVNFYKDVEIDAFATVVIKVLADNLLKMIVLKVPENMKPGNTYQLSAAFSPADSPEIEKLCWQIKDPNIAQIDASGNLHALRAGKTVAYAKAERTEASVEITVLPHVKKIQLSKEKLELVHGDASAYKAELWVTLEPAECALSRISCKTTNANIATVEKGEDGQWIVTAKGVQANNEGFCKIIFTDDDGLCQGVCDVTIKNVFSTPSHKGGALAVTGIMTLAAFVFQLFGGGFGTIGLLAASVIAFGSGISGVVKTRKNVFWQILLMALCALMVINRLS